MTDKSDNFKTLEFDLQNNNTGTTIRSVGAYDLNWEQERYCLHNIKFLDNNSVEIHKYDEDYANDQPWTV